MKVELEKTFLGNRYREKSLDAFIPVEMLPEKPEKEFTQVSFLHYDNRTTYTWTVHPKALDYAEAVLSNTAHEYYTQTNNQAIITIHANQISVLSNTGNLFQTISAGFEANGLTVQEVKELKKLH